MEAINFLKGEKHPLWFAPRPISSAATAFLRNNTAEGQRVAILSETDWAYLLDARRPSAFYWLPLHLTHSWILLERNTADLQSANTVFIEDGYWEVITKWNALASEQMRAIVERCFIESVAGEGWHVFKRNSECTP